MKKREIFRIPYGYIEEFSFDSQKTALDDYLDNNTKVDAEQNKRIDEEIKRSTDEDKSFKEKLDLEINRAKLVESKLYESILALNSNLELKADWDNGTYIYIK